MSYESHYVYTSNAIKKQGISFCLSLGQSHYCDKNGRRLKAHVKDVRIVHMQFSGIILQMV